ncbi:hypothetical protein BDD12DRAFT_881947 [Trichophaea hybrida]|nr:hypothetical protein BDD12DRAFT_881947 [Trichophaea hybrida]
MRLYDLDVQLMTQNHVPLLEYGFIRRNSRGIASVYVPSITNISFYIRIEARPQQLNLSKFDWEQLSVAVYVDKEDGDNQSAHDSAVMVTRSSNCAELRGRKAMLPDGTTAEQKWAFLEMGIESRFDVLLSLGDELKHKSGGAGKITVQVHWVHTLKKCPKGIRWPLLENTADIEEVNLELDHIIGQAVLTSPYQHLLTSGAADTTKRRNCPIKKRQSLPPNVPFNLKEMSTGAILAERFRKSLDRSI